MFKFTTDKQIVVRGRIKYTLLAHTFKNNRVSSVNFSPNGSSFISGSDDTTIKLWSIDGTLIRTFTGHNDVVTSVNFSPVEGPDCLSFISGSLDRKIKLWDIKLWDTRQHKYILGSAAISNRKTKTKTTTGLGDLPTELRERIYNYLFSNKKNKKERKKRNKK